MTPPRLNSVLTQGNAINRGSGYDLMHGSYENFGIFNGAFEQGPSGQVESAAPEGWGYTVIGAGGTFLRTTGGYAGNWCAMGGQVGMGAGVDLVAQKYMPVSELYIYYYQFAACETNSGTVRAGLYCYDAAKGALASVWGAAAFIPASTYPAWTLYYYYAAPGAMALTATTRYVRPIIRLQVNAALTDAWTYVDDVKFQQVPRWAWPQ